MCLNEGRDGKGREMRNLYSARELYFPSETRKLMRAYFSMNLRLSCPSDTSLLEAKCCINCQPGT